LSKKSNLQEEPVVDWETACFFNCSGHVIPNEAVSVNCELERRGGKDSFALFPVAMCEKAQETRMRIGASGIQTSNDIRLQKVCCDVWLDRTACLRADDNTDAWRLTVAPTLQCPVRSYKYSSNLYYRNSICMCGICLSSSGQNWKASLF